MKGAKDKSTGRFVKTRLPQTCVICSSIFETYFNKKTCSSKCGSTLTKKNKETNGTTRKGVPRPAEVRAKISASHIGIRPSKEAIAKMIAAKKGKPGKRGWKHSEEAKMKNSLAHRGEGGSGWKGGLTTLIRMVRRGIKYRNWRTSVYERDDYTCTECGDGESYLNADHIIQFAFLLRLHKIVSVEQAEACAELWDITNGRTLCVPCHKETATYLNKGKVYLKQFNL